jgi:hypothetical protein
MESIFNKLRVNVLGGLASALNSVEEHNTVPAQQIRVDDLKKARINLQAELSRRRYDRDNAATTLHAHEAQIAKMTADARALSDPKSNPSAQSLTSAKVLATEIMKIQGHLAEEQANLATFEQDVANFTSAVERALQIEQAAQTQLGKLRADVATKTSLTRATKAIDAVGTAADAAGSVNNAVSNAAREAAVAKDAFNHALEGLGGPSPDLTSANADAFLASLHAGPTSDGATSDRATLLEDDIRTVKGDKAA